MAHGTNEGALWGGRFSGGPADALAALSKSTDFDWRLARYDIAGSKAHAHALHTAGLLNDAEYDGMLTALEKLDADVVSGAYAAAESDEDVHGSLERGLIERAGPELGGKLRAGRSRNDQIATLIRLFIRDQARAVGDQVLDLVDVLVARAREVHGAPMPGRTHLQHAQPLLRDVERLRDLDARADSSPYGSGALAGSSLGVDPQAVARELGFGDSVWNSIDGTASRDLTAEFSFVLAMIGIDLSRLAEEVILWNTKEFSFITLDDSYSTGSSIMPQKKNPDFAELTRGKTGRVYGDLMALLTTMKSLPLAYNKDLQECKEGPLDAARTLSDCMEIAAGMIETMTVNADVMLAQAGTGFSAATDVADYLAKKGMPFREAHRVVGELVLYCEKNGKGLEDLTAEEFSAASPLFGADIARDLDPAGIANARVTYGGTGRDAVVVQLGEARTALEKDEGALR